jgi:hypothetical protein
MSFLLASEIIVITVTTVSTSPSPMSRQSHIVATDTVTAVTTVTAHHSHRSHQSPPSQHAQSRQSPQSHHHRQDSHHSPCHHRPVTSVPQSVSLVLHKNDRSRCHPWTALLYTSPLRQIKFTHTNLPANAQRALRVGRGRGADFLTCWPTAESNSCQRPSKIWCGLTMNVLFGCDIEKQIKKSVWKDSRKKFDLVHSRPLDCSPPLGLALKRRFLNGRGNIVCAFNRKRLIRLVDLFWAAKNVVVEFERKTVDKA